MRILKYLLDKFSIYTTDLELSRYSRINRFSIFRNTIINDYSYVGPNARINNCVIGKYCSISSNLTIGLASHPTDRFSSSPIFFRQDNGVGIDWVKGFFYDDNIERTIVGNDVWIGDNVTIIGGVSIGNGAVLASGCIVTKDVGAYEVVGGVPAKVIKKRFNELIVNKLEDLKWWDFDVDFIRESISYFQSPLTVEIIDKIKKEYSNYENKR